MTTIVHYGAGNLHSVARALERLEEPSTISSDPAVIARAERLILPGVGSFDAAMTGLGASGLLPVLEDKVHQEKVPVLGICLGMQLFTFKSEEGSLPGLGWIPGQTRRFIPTADATRVPHIGWNEVRPRRPSDLLAHLPEVPAFYFVHSYYVTCDDAADVLAESSYACPFISAVRRDNIVGVQFHPEKSQHLGLQLLANFLKMSPAC